MSTWKQTKSKNFFRIIRGKKFDEAGLPLLIESRKIEKKLAFIYGVLAGMCLAIAVSITVILCVFHFHVFS